MFSLNKKRCHLYYWCVIIRNGV